MCFKKENETVYYDTLRENESTIVTQVIKDEEQLFLFLIFCFFYALAYMNT